MKNKLLFILSLTLVFSVSCKKVNQKKSDITPPQGASILINSGDAVTTSDSVVLTLSATDAMQMYVTNTSGCSSGGSWENYTTSKSWVLAQTNATATVYVKYRDSAQNETGCVSDTIEHDSSAPTGGSITINSGAAATNSTNVTLTLTATDANKMYVTNVAGCGSGGTWEDFAGTFGWTLGQTNTTATVYVKYRDINLNETGCFSDTIIHDNQIPTGESVSINSNASYTNSTAITLTLAVTGASQMCVTNTAGCSCANPSDWEDFNATKAWTLGQTNATATVYVKYRDAALNETACINDTIIHDNQAPTDGTIAIDNGNASTTSTSVTLNLSATGASDMYITNTAGCATDGTLYSYATTKAWTLGQTNGTATVYVKFIDAAGNESGCLSDTITQVDDPPTVGTGISFTNIADTSVTVNWGAASDTITGSAALQYKVVRASSNTDIDTVSEADSATAVTDWTNNITSTSATGLTGATTYYFAIIVKDESNNKALYAPGRRFTGKMIYVTTQGFKGDFGGITGADQKCSDYRQTLVDSTSIVKAMIVDGTNRRACTSDNCSVGGTAENIDWAMLPNTKYYNKNGELLWTTNAGGVKDLSYSGGSIDTLAGTLAWTGLGGGGYGKWQSCSNGADHSCNCYGWSSNVWNLDYAHAGSPADGGILIVYHGGYSCGENYRIYCVEQ